MALLPAHDPGAHGCEMLHRLAQFAVLSAEEYVRCLEIARDIRRNGTREDVQEFLVAVDPDDPRARIGRGRAGRSSRF